MQKFTHQVTLTGRVAELAGNAPAFMMRCRSGETFVVHVSDQTWFRPLFNLDKLNQDRYGTPEGHQGSVADQVRKYVAPGCLVCIQGVLLENDGQRRVDARRVHALYAQQGSAVRERLGHLAFEGGRWWLDQITALADTWLDGLFGQRDQYDFTQYRTRLGITFRPEESDLQEMATLSRLIYGLSSAYLLTGGQRYLDAARAGVSYQREHFRFSSHDGRHVFWAFGKRGAQRVVPSQNPDDLNTIPLYEQIYALAGLTQYYRITNDWETLDDIQRYVLGGDRLDSSPKRRSSCHGAGICPRKRAGTETDTHGGPASHKDYPPRNGQPIA